MAYKRRDAGGGREMYGNYMISGGYPHKVYSPKGDKPGNKTEMRLFCAVDPSGEFSPQVVVADEPTEGISDSFHSRECVAWLGSKKMQFVTETSDFPATKISPARLFFNSIGELVEQEGKKKFAEHADEHHGEQVIPAQPGVRHRSEKPVGMTRVRHRRRAASRQ